MILPAALIGAAVVAALLDDRSPGAARAFKMAASSAVLVLVFLVSPEISPYVVLIVVGLAASWVGDLALTFEGRSSFIVGLVAFAGAHVAYIAAFVARGPLDMGVLGASAVVMTVFAIVVLRWLSPHRPRELQVPVTVYVVIISVMVATAFASHANTPNLSIPVAAVLLAASDLFVARQRFVTRSSVNRFIGPPLYFAAQILFALSVAS